MPACGQESRWRIRPRDDLLRSRQPFLYSEADFGAVVVHGHTPVKTPVVRHNRIAIDTGAVFGGQLTCVVLEADTLGFLTADPVDPRFRLLIGNQALTPRQVPPPPGSC